MTTRLGLFLFGGLLLGALLGFAWLGAPAMWAILFGVIGLVIGGMLDFVGIKAMNLDEDDDGPESQPRDYPDKGADL